MQAGSQRGTAKGHGLFSGAQFKNMGLCSRTWGSVQEHEAVFKNMKLCLKTIMIDFHYDIRILSAKFMLLISQY